MTVLDLSDGQLRGKRALVRVDYNVPLDEDNAVADDARIRATLPTVEYLRGRGARIVLMSHLGRPKGKPNAALSLASVAECLRELLDRRVAFAPHPVSDETIAASLDLEPGGVLLLENTRFHPGETANDPAFAQSLAALGDVYVNDAFGTAHRAHASTTGVAQHLRPAVVGLLMERELTHLGKLLENPERPFIAVLGGGKVSGKIELIENLLSKVDRLCVGGAMSGTFFKAMGLEVG
ncbi:MAG: phosphoglycerate kinase, partial [Gammaproteobacteria bacterium]